MIFTLLLEAFSIAADTLMDWRYMSWSSIKDTSGVTTSVRPGHQAHTLELRDKETNNSCWLTGANVSQDSRTLRTVLIKGSLLYGHHLSMSK